MLKPSAVVELIWQDATGSTGVTQLNAPSTLDREVIAADAAALAAIVVPLTNCSLIGIRVRYKTEPALPVLLTGGSPITKTGIFFFSTGPSTPDALVSVPALKDSVVLSSGPTAGVGIDLSNTDVMTFASAVVSGGMSNPFADVFTALFAAYIQSRV